MSSGLRLIQDYVLFQNGIFFYSPLYLTSIMFLLFCGLPIFMSGDCPGVTAAILEFREDGDTAAMLDCWDSEIVTPSGWWWRLRGPEVSANMRACRGDDSMT